MRGLSQTKIGGMIRAFWGRSRLLRHQKYLRRAASNNKAVRNILNVCKKTDFVRCVSYYNE